MRTVARLLAASRTRSSMCLPFAVAATSAGTVATMFSRRESKMPSSVPAACQSSPSVSAALVSDPSSFHDLHHNLHRDRRRRKWCLRCIAMRGRGRLLGIGRGSFGQRRNAPRGGDQWGSVHWWSWP